MPYAYGMNHNIKYNSNTIFHLCNGVNLMLGKYSVFDNFNNMLHIN